MVMLELTEAKWLFSVLAKDGRSEGGTGKLSVDTEEPVASLRVFQRADGCGFFSRRWWKWSNLAFRWSQTTRFLWAL